MTSFWHPLSALLLCDPPCFATTRLLEMLLLAGDVELRYAGDRMWPTLDHGTRLVAQRLDGRELRIGELVVATPEGVPDLLRVAAVDGDSVDLVADADPQPPVRFPRSSIVACTAPPASGPRFGDSVPTPGLRARRRRRLDLREAWFGRNDAAGSAATDPARTVLAKYDNQAPFYANAGGQELEPKLLERIRCTVNTGCAVLVLGSGSGKECFVLAAEGYRVDGIDFAPAMVRVASEEAARRDLAIDFRAEDLRSMNLEPASFDAVLFTYDVYSFLPDAASRVAVLRNLQQSLRPGGTVFLSARRLKTHYQRLMLTLQWVANPPRDPALWGRSHTRWIAMDGRMNRSFVQVFSDGRLSSEIRAAGFSAGTWQGGHAALTPLS